MNDRQLLHQFVHEHSQAAFRELFQRHTHWLYSVCLRRLRDPALAEDAVQAIFLALARKAPTLLHQPTLSPWLHQAAKFACANLQRAEKRRARHESEAAAMIPTTADDQWPHIESDLEPALDRLPERDRQTLLLRFYEQRSHAQIAATLHISEAAAHKRLARALDRLRSLLLTRGHRDLSAAALPTLLLSHAVTPAPATLTTTLATVSTAAVPAHLAPTTNGILHALSWLKLQLWGAIAAAATGAIVLGTTGLVLVHHALAASPVPVSTPVSAPPLVAASAPPPASAPATAPAASGFVVKIANQDFIFNQNPNADEFKIESDPATKRTPASAPATHIQCLAGAVLRPTVPAQSGTVIPAFAFKGKRIHVTAWIKTADVDNWASIQLVTLDAGKHLYTFADLSARPITGTTDWQQVELISDVPNNASLISVSTALYGTGEVWSDDFQVSVAPRNTPTTDDQNWLKWSPYAPDYSATEDPNNPHDNHPSILLAYVGPSYAPKDAWGQYNHQMRDNDIKQYAGHHIRLSVYLKTERAGYCGPNIRSRDAAANVVTRDSGYMHRTLRGTHDWQLYSTECDIPKNAASIDSGVVLNAKGKVWIDLNSVQYEIIDGQTAPAAPAAPIP